MKKNLECFSDDSQMSASQTSTSLASANETENEENLEPNNSMKLKPCFTELLWS